MERISPDIIQSRAVVLPVGITLRRSLSMSKHGYTASCDYPSAVVTMISTISPGDCMLWCVVRWKVSDSPGDRNFPATYRAAGPSSASC